MKVILNKLYVVLPEQQAVIFCTEITLISRVIPISTKGSANYE